MNSLRKEAVIQFFAMLLNNQTLSVDDQSRFNALYKQSEDSLQLVSFLQDEKDDVAQIKPFIQNEEIFVISPSQLFVEEDVLESLDNIDEITSSRESKTTLDHPNTINTESSTAFLSTPEKTPEICDSKQFELNFKNQLLQEDDEEKETGENSLANSDPSAFFRSLID